MTLAPGLVQKFRKGDVEEHLCLIRKVSIDQSSILLYSKSASTVIVSSAACLTLHVNYLHLQ